MKNYRVAPRVSDPTLTIRLSATMLKDLVKRSEENGRDINVELAIRLARTLENDLQRIAEDEKLSADCLAYVHANAKFKD